MRGAGFGKRPVSSLISGSVPWAICACSHVKNAFAEELGQRLELERGKSDETRASEALAQVLRPLRAQGTRSLSFSIGAGNRQPCSGWLSSQPLLTCLAKLAGRRRTIVHLGIVFSHGQNGQIIKYGKPLKVHSSTFQGSMLSLTAAPATLPRASYGPQT